MPNIDVSEEGVGKKLVNQLGMLGGGGGMTEGGVKGFDVVVSRGCSWEYEREEKADKSRSSRPVISRRKILSMVRSGRRKSRCIVRLPLPSSPIPIQPPLTTPPSNIRYLSTFYNPRSLPR